MNISAQIIKLRKQKGITQKELAAVLGVTDQAVSKWESEICCPDIQLLPDIAEYFEVSVDELMGLDRKPRTADLRDISEEIKSLFRQSDKSELSTLAFRLAAVLHEGISSGGYDSGIPWGKSVSESDDGRFKGWGGSICAENDGETAYVGSSLFFSSHKFWKEISSEEINIIRGKLGKLSDKNSLKVIFAIYELTLNDIDGYVGIDEIAEKSRLSVSDVEAALKGLDVSVMDSEQGERYRLSGAFMYVPAMLRTLCEGFGLHRL